MRNWTLPDRLPGEQDEDWCHRAAATIPAEDLMAAVIAWLDRREKHKRRIPAWSWIADVTGHGSSVSAAICMRFRRMEETTPSNAVTNDVTKQERSRVFRLGSTGEPS